MSVWMIGSGSISIKPQVDDALIKEYIQFSKKLFSRRVWRRKFYQYVVF